MNNQQELFEATQEHLLEDACPSEYLESLNDAQSLIEYPFMMLAALKDAQQSPVYHPEGNVWKHTMLVVDEAAQRKSKSSDPRVFMWAALLHDLGKPGTTRIRKGKITSYDHDKLGAQLAREFLEQFKEDQEFIKKVSSLIRFHMQILFVVKSLPFAQVNKMKEQTNVDDVALLGLCDRLGRLGADKREEEENIRLFLKKCAVNSSG